MSRKWNTRKIFPFIKAKYFGLLHNNEKCITLKFFFWGMWSLRNWKSNASFLTNMDFYLTYVRTTRSHNTDNMRVHDKSVSLKSNFFDQMTHPLSIVFFRKTCNHQHFKHLQKKIWLELSNILSSRIVKCAWRKGALWQKD